MQNQQIIQYIHHHIQQGHTEASLRDHFQRSGWAEAAIDHAFAQYRAALHPTTAPPVQEPAKPGNDRPTAKNTKKKWLIRIGIGILVIIVGSFVYLAASPRANDKLAQPALERHAQNTASKNDVSMILAGISSYINENNGKLPQTTMADTATKSINLCGASCNGATVKVNLSHYDPDAVAYRPYSDSLKVLDTRTLYIVNGAICNSQNNGLAGNSSGLLAAAVLFGAESDSGVQQECVSL